MSRMGGAGRGLLRLTRAKNVPSFTSVTSCKAQNRVFAPLQALQSSKTGFLCHCRHCNRPKPGFYAIAGVAIAQNRVFMPLQALQSSKTGFLRHCRHCNRPKPGFCTIAGIAIAQNQILEDLHGLQWLRIRFWKNCKVCNGSESDSGGIARSAMAQNQILEELHGLQWLRIRFWRICMVCKWPGIRFWGALRTNLGLEMGAPHGLSGWGDVTPVDPALARRRTWAKRGSVPSRG